MPHSRFLRFLVGMALVLLIAVPGFAIANAQISTFGMEQGELNQTLPGDELLPTPIIYWQHAVTINARPEEVWPWIIQIGDTRAGFYSYMFIEQLIGGPGLYHNADRVHPEWQNPPKGQGLIGDWVVLREYQPGQYMISEATEKMGGLGWTWLWRITPTGNGRTRLTIHMRIQAPPGTGGEEGMKTFMNLGGFIMERNMMTGLKTRVEGGSEPGFTEPLEIILWLAALAAGLVAAARFITRPDWRLPLTLGLAALIVLFWLTFIQPSLWLRLLAVVALTGGLVWESHSKSFALLAGG
jgi:hypothetical protein